MNRGKRKGAESVKRLRCLKIRDEPVLTGYDGLWVFGIGSQSNILRALTMKSTTHFMANPPPFLKPQLPTKCAMSILSSSWTRERALGRWCKAEIEYFVYSRIFASHKRTALRKCHRFPLAFRHQYFTVIFAIIQIFITRRQFSHEYGVHHFAFRSIIWYRMHFCLTASVWLTQF